MVRALLAPALALLLCTVARAEAQSLPAANELTALRQRMAAGPQLLSRLAAPRFSVARPDGAPDDAMRGIPSAADSACWDCDRTKQPVVAFFEWQIGMWPAWAFNKFLREGNIGDVGPSFWAKNMFGRWDWDPNSFDINQIGHPAQGSMYFNGYRTNGYGFYTSSAMTLLGSFVWECCGERNLPSNNDLLTTWIGGTTLGEVSRRLSDLWIDNQASGAERFWLEVSAGLVNPVRGIDRLARGHAWRAGPNPPDVKPAFLQGSLGVGGVVLGSQRLTGRETLSGIKVAPRLIYGTLADAAGRPFSYFEFEGEFTSIPNAHIYLFRSRGSLFGRYIGAAGDSSRMFAGFMRYEYVRSRAFELGAQAISLDIIRQRRLDERTRLYADVGLRIVPIAAIEDDFVAPSAEGRNYDYTFGGGLTTHLTIMRDRVGMIRYTGFATAYRVANGVASSHMLTRSEVFVQKQLGRTSGLGVGLRHQARRTFFVDRPETTARAPEVWVSFQRALPRWEY